MKSKRIIMLSGRESWLLFSEMTLIGKALFKTEKKEKRSVLPVVSEQDWGQLE